MIRAERAYGNFHRTMSLPADADEAKISAITKDGVLRIAIPKAPMARPRTTRSKFLRIGRRRAVL